MPLDVPPTLRVLDDKNDRFMVSFVLRLVDHYDIVTSPVTSWFGNTGGALVDVDLQTLLTPLRDSIPPFKTLQVSMEQIGTDPTSDSMVGVYIVNPSTLQSVALTPTPPSGGVGSTLNFAIPFYADITTKIQFFRASGSNPLVDTNCYVVLQGLLLTYDVPSYWANDSAGWATNPTIPQPNDAINLTADVLLQRYKDQLQFEKDTPRGNPLLAQK